MKSAHDTLSPLATNRREVLITEGGGSVMRKSILLFAAVFFSTLAPTWALGNGLARTPPVGWNSWNKFGCGVNEKLIRGMAATMV
jgi:alpha-galactosidase